MDHGLSKAILSTGTRPARIRACICRERATPPAVTGAERVGAAVARFLLVHHFQWPIFWKTAGARMPEDLKT